MGENRGTVGSTSTCQTTKRPESRSTWRTTLEANPGPEPPSARRTPLHAPASDPWFPASSTSLLHRSFPPPRQPPSKRNQFSTLSALFLHLSRSQFLKREKNFLRLSSNHCWWRADAWTRRRFNWYNPNRFSQFSFGNVYSVILTSLLLIWGRWWKMKIGFSFFFYYCVRKEERKGSWIFEIDIFFWFNFFGRDYATDCNIEFLREDQFFDEEVSWACAILFVYFVL